MSAFNEERVILAKVRNLLAIKESVPDCRVYIYVDAATDRTAALLAPYNDVVTVVVGAERRGKSHGLNVLMRHVVADVVLFTDANVEIQPDALKWIGPWFHDPRVGCVAGHLVYVNSHQTGTSTGGTLYWQVEELIRQLESDVFNVIGADGSIFAIRRSLHPEVPDDIIDDFYVSMKILCGGHRVVREQNAVAFEPSATSGTEEFRRKVRIACQAFNCHRLLWSDIRQSWMLAYCYVSHRLLKWLIVYNMTLAVLFGMAAAFYYLPAVTVIIAFASAMSVFALALALKLRSARAVAAMLVAFVGVGYGVWRSIRGDRYQTWTPTVTAREPVAAKEAALDTSLDASPAAPPKRHLW